MCACVVCDNQCLTITRHKDSRFIKEVILWPFKLVFHLLQWVWAPKMIMKMLKFERVGRFTWAETETTTTTVNQCSGYDLFLVHFWSVAHHPRKMMLSFIDYLFIDRLLFKRFSFIKLLFFSCFDAWIMRLFCAHLHNEQCINKAKWTLYLNKVVTHYLFGMTLNGRERAGEIDLIWIK